VSVGLSVSREKQSANDNDGEPTNNNQKKPTTIPDDHREERKR